MILSQNFRPKHIASEFAVVLVVNNHLIKNPPQQIHTTKPCDFIKERNKEKNKFHWE